MGTKGALCDALARAMGLTAINSTRPSQAENGLLLRMRECAVADRSLGELLAVAARCQIGVELAADAARLNAASTEQIELAIDFIEEALQPYERDASGVFRAREAQEERLPPGTVATLKRLYLALRTLEEELMLNRAPRGSA